jgi:hypothetical protein
VKNISETIKEQAIRDHDIKNTGVETKLWNYPSEAPEFTTGFKW